MRSEFVEDDSILHHDNVLPIPCARVFGEKKHSNSAVPIGPDIISRFFLILKMKLNLKGTHHSVVEEVQETVGAVLGGLTSEAYQGVELT